MTKYSLLCKPLAAIHAIVCVWAIVALSACRQATSSQAVSAPVSEVEAPRFNADSAYHYIEKQLSFGYRIPNTPAHRAASEYLASELRRFGGEITVQEACVTAYDGTVLNARNIIAAFSPEKKDRVLLFAHWDSRPYADNDPDVKNHRKPILGANDGASGVAVLLEIARQIQTKSPRIGIDIILFDAEDYGQPYFAEQPDRGDTWALGSQYWARRPHNPAYRARYGILLDMVGGKNSRFPREGVSMQQAPGLVDKVWNAARKLGYGDYFVDEQGGYINDDHVYVGRRVPSIDIIAYDGQEFVPQWHTLDDTIEHIDRATLEAVGQTVLHIIYNE
ncbi:MAG: M28 family peptidase [Coprobacter sp.]|nr:M28 family peptidase [Coprobacter sp.]